MKLRGSSSGRRSRAAGSLARTAAVRRQNLHVLWHAGRHAALMSLRRLVCSPAIRSECRSLEGLATPGGEYGDAAAAVAAKEAGQSLYERLLAVLAALLSGTWASWLHGDQVSVLTFTA